MQNRSKLLFWITILSFFPIAVLLVFLSSPLMAAAGSTQEAQSPEQVTEIFSAFLSGDQEVPPVDTEASGVASFSLIDSTTLNYEVAVSDIVSITASHIHLGAAGVNGGVVFPLFTGAGDFDPQNPISGSLMLTEDQANDLRAGNYYVNVHTTNHPPGEIRGQIMPAQTTAYQTSLSPAQETASVQSEASGQAFLTLSPDMSQLYYRVLVADITDVTAAHIHEAPAGVNGGVILTLFDGTGDFDPQHPVSGVLSPTISQVSAILAGNTYVNVHTSDYPSGEIRGQVASFEPSSDFHALLSGAQEVPPVETDAVGVGRFQLSDDLATLSYTVAVDAISDISASHLHTAQPGQNGGVAHTLYGGGGTFGPGNPVSDALAFDAPSVLDLISGHYYVNVHTPDNPAGEIRGQVVRASLFQASLSGDQEVPPVPTGASGSAVLAVNEDASQLYYRVMVQNIDDISASHIHEAPVGENGGVVYPLYTGVGDFDEQNPVSGVLDLADENIFALLSENYYVNVHTEAYPAGEIRGQIFAFDAPDHLQAQLSGDQEVPPVETQASGQGDFTLDSVRNILHFQIAVSEIDDIAASHIHLAPAGQNGGVVFPLYLGDGPFDPDNPIGSGLMLGAENLVDLLTGYYYVNVHTIEFPAGEIRGQIGPVIVDEMIRVYMPVVMRDE